MTIAAVLGKIPWKQLFRILAGTISIAGGLSKSRAGEAQADTLTRIEARQQDLEKDLEKAAALIASRLKLLFWIASAALVTAIAALVIALAR